MLLFFTRRIFKKDVFIIKFFTNGSYADYRVDESDQEKSHLDKAFKVI